MFEECVTPQRANEHGNIWVSFFVWIAGFSSLNMASYEESTRNRSAAYAALRKRLTA